MSLKISANIHTKIIKKIIFADDKVELPIELHGPIPFIPVKNPTDIDMDTHQWLSLTDPNEWTPNLPLNSELSSDWNCEVDYTISNIYHQISRNIVISSVHQKQKQKDLTPEKLSKLWPIDLNKAKYTINATSYKSI